LDIFTYVTQWTRYDPAGRIPIYEGNQIEFIDLLLWLTAFQFENFLLFNVKLDDRQIHVDRNLNYDAHDIDTSSIYHHLKPMIEKFEDFMNHVKPKVPDKINRNHLRFFNNQVVTFQDQKNVRLIQRGVRKFLARNGWHKQIAIDRVKVQNCPKEVLETEAPEEDFHSTPIYAQPNFLHFICGGITASANKDDELTVLGCSTSLGCLKSNKAEINSSPAVNSLC